MSADESSLPRNAPAVLHRLPSSNREATSDSSWEHLSHHRGCSDHLQHLEECEGQIGSLLNGENSWMLASRPVSPHLQVPATGQDPWQHLQRFQADRQVALDLHEELEGRPFLPAPPSAAETSQASDETPNADWAEGHCADPQPTRYEDTPPPEPVDDLKTALKHFQHSEGSRLYGFQQCNPEARASLIKYLMDAGNDEQAAICIADEIDGFEELNGLSRNEHGVWYRIKDGEKGRSRKFDPLANLKPEYHHRGHHHSRVDHNPPKTTISNSQEIEEFFAGLGIRKGTSNLPEQAFILEHRDRKQSSHLRKVDKAGDVSDCSGKDNCLDEVFMPELRGLLD